MNVMVLSSTLPEGIKYDMVEPWFEVPYTVLGEYGFYVLVDTICLWGE